MAVNTSTTHRVIAVNNCAITNCSITIAQHEQMEGPGYRLMVMVANRVVREPGRYGLSHCCSGRFVVPEPSLRGGLQQRVLDATTLTVKIVI